MNKRLTDRQLISVEAKLEYTQPEFLKDLKPISKCSTDLSKYAQTFYS